MGSTPFCPQISREHMHPHRSNIAEEIGRNAEPASSKRSSAPLSTINS
jgi:hypothetical protein